MRDSLHNDLPPLPLQDPFRFAEYMVGAFADSAKIYWWTLGPRGEPMIRAVDAWADWQRQNLELLRLALRQRI